MAEHNQNQEKQDEILIDGKPLSSEEMEQRGVIPSRDEVSATGEQQARDEQNSPADASAEPADSVGEAPTEHEMEVRHEEVTVENVAAAPGASTGPSPAERMANNAREQAGAAANALRRGEFMSDASVDPTADGDDRLIALLTYVTQILIPFVMPAIVLLSESSKKRPFQRFHAVQSLALTAALVVLAIFIGVGTAIISIVPVIGWLVALVVGCLSPIALLMAWFALVYYGYQAYQGKRFAIPGLTAFMKDQGWV